MPNVEKTSFTAGEWKPSLWQRVDLSRYGNAAKVIRNYIIHAGGGISNRGGTRYINRAKYADRITRLISFEYNTEQAYALEFGDNYMRVFKDGGAVLEADQAITGITQANPAVVTITSHPFSDGDWIFVSTISGMTELNGDFFIVANSAANTFELNDLDGNPIDSSAFTAYASGGTAARVYEITSPYGEADLALLKFTQDANTMTLTHPDYDVRELTRTGHTSWSFSTPTFAPSIAAPTSVSLSGPASSGGSETISYKVTAIDEETGEESLPSTAGTTAAGKLAWTSTDYIDLSWTGSSGAASYNIYKDDGGYYGFIGRADGTSFRDDNIQPAVDDAPPEARNPFSGSDDKPSVPIIHRQRRVFGRTNDKPDTLFMSQVGLYSNMNVSRPAKADDAITATLAAQKVNEIRGFVSLNDLIILTSGSEWRVRGADNQTITPSSIIAEKQSDRGASDIPPLVIGNTALFVQARGKKVRDLGYTIEFDGYDGNDLTILSSHLTKKTRSVDKRISEWCYQQEPDSIVWSVHKDGSLTSMTYAREHEVRGWSRHDTQGNFKSLCCIPEDDQDRVYFVVEREINSQTLQYIEVMETRDVDEDDLIYAFHLDCGITIDGNGQQTITGLGFLEGKTVAIWADGNELPQENVVGGSITLDKVYTTLSIGLPIESDMQPLDIEFNRKEEGTTKGYMKKVNRLYLEVYNAREIKVAAKDPNDPFLDPDESVRFEKFKQREWEDYDEPTRLRNGIIEVEVDAEWQHKAAPFIRHDSPAPITILGIIPQIEISSG